MSLREVLDLLRESPMDTGFILRLGEIPSCLLHQFACDCAERVFRNPRSLQDFPEAPLRQLLEAKRAWIEGRVGDAELQAFADAARLLMVEPSDAVLAVLRAAEREPLQAALQASQRSAWACFERTFDQELQETEQRLRHNEWVGPFMGDEPVTAALQFLGQAFLAPRRTAERLLESFRDEMGEVVDDFQQSFSSRSEEITWQRQHLIALLEDVQVRRQRILGVLYQRALERDQTLQRNHVWLEGTLFGS